MLGDIFSKGGYTEEEYISCV